MKDRGLIALVLLLTVCVCGMEGPIPESEKARVTTSTSSAEGNVDLRKSVIYWKGTKLMNSRSHEGFLKLQEGNLVVEQGLIKGGSFLADITTIQVTDIPKHEAEARANLEMHLKSDFNTDQFPYSQFTITSVSQSGSSQQICGNLQIRDVKQEICFETTSQGKLWSTSLILNRSEWNIGVEGSWLEKRLVDEAFYLEIELWVK